MWALYISPMEYAANVTVDALSHAPDCTLAEAGIELRVAYAGFRKEDWLPRTEKLIRAASLCDPAAVVLYSIDAIEPAAAVAEARQRGVRVVCLERPRFDVDASVVLPNFNHGLYLAEYLSTLIPMQPRVGVIGGPGTADDDELVLGIVHGLASLGLTRINDPNDPRYRRILDVRAEGRSKAANLLADFAELDAIVPYSDEATLGTIDALREAGRLGQVKIASRNGSPEVIQLVAEGLHHGTWDHDVLGVGRLIGELVARLVVEKGTLNGLCVASPIGHIITPALARRWRPWHERINWRSLRGWSAP